MIEEKDLIRRAGQGDSDAFRQLVETYQAPVYRLALRMCGGDAALAEDAAQETFLKAVRHIDAYAHRGRFKAYLYKIAANTCTDLWRRSGRREPTEPEEYIEPGFARVEAELSLAQLLSTLTAKQREVVELRYVHDLKLREIAEIVDEPLRTVQSRLRSALKTLERSL